jgi:hypothetical protein
MALDYAKTGMAGLRMLGLEFSMITALVNIEE